MSSQHHNPEKKAGKGQEKDTDSIPIPPTRVLPGPQKPKYQGLRRYASFWNQETASTCTPPDRAPSPSPESRPKPKPKPKPNPKELRHHTSFWYQETTSTSPPPTESKRKTKPHPQKLQKRRPIPSLPKSPTKTESPTELQPSHQLKEAFSTGKFENQELKESESIFSLRGLFKRDENRVQESRGQSTRPDTGKGKGKENDIMSYNSRITDSTYSRTHNPETHHRDGPSSASNASFARPAVFTPREPDGILATPAFRPPPPQPKIMTEYQYLKLHGWACLEEFGRAYRPKTWEVEEDVDLRAARELLRTVMKEDQRIWEVRYGNGSKDGKEIEGKEGGIGARGGGMMERGI